MSGNTDPNGNDDGTGRGLLTRRNVVAGVAVAVGGAAVAGGIIHGGDGGPGGDAAAGSSADGGAGRDGVSVRDVDHVLGDSAAPELIVEYASLTCPHCAAFHAESFPGVRERYVDDGKVRFVFRHFPLDGLALDAAAVAECFEGRAFFAFIEMLFERQREWVRSGRDGIERVARMAGMTGERFERCVNDGKVRARILADQKRASNVFGVNVTPSFIVNGELVKGNVGPEEFAEHFQNPDH